VSDNHPEKNAAVEAIAVPTHWNSLFRHPVRVLRRIPLTLVLLTLILASGIATQTFARNDFQWLMDRFGWSLTALEHGKVWVLWVGLLFGSKPGHFITILGVGLLGVGALEYHRGTRWAAFGFLKIGRAHV
jgi:hypothetical protein